MADVPALKPIHERKLCELLACDEQAGRWEASGVLVKGDDFYVVFDDRTEIARISADLEPRPTNGLFGTARGVPGYEGISYNAGRQRYYLLVEAREHNNGSYHAAIVEYDDEFEYVKDRPVTFEFESGNKGFEAVAHVQRDGEDFVLALCEGNKCKCGKKGRKPGGGRVQVFEKTKKRWSHADVIALPTSVPFEDYSGMSIDHGRVAIVSQVNSLLWVGEFDKDSWSWRDEGQLYEFPRTDEGSILYGNIEGVGWITPTQIVAVSDRRKKSIQPDKALGKKDQSIHVFDLPA